MLRLPGCGHHASRGFPITQRRPRGLKPMDSHAPQTVRAEVTVKFTNEPKPRQLSDSGVSYACTTEPDGILIVTAKTDAGE